MLKRDEVLAAAAKAVSGDRQKQYGDPGVNLGRTAALWSSAFGVEFSARDVALAMILVKVSRACGSGDTGFDTLVDICGYAALAAEVG
jgi:Domain of unknown function (DUF6378)